MKKPSFRLSFFFQFLLACKLTFVFHPMEQLNQVEKPDVDSHLWLIKQWCLPGNSPCKCRCRLTLYLRYWTCWRISLSSGKQNLPLLQLQHPLSTFIASEKMKAFMVLLHYSHGCSWIPSRPSELVLHMGPFFSSCLLGLPCFGDAILLLKSTTMVDDVLEVLYLLCWKCALTSLGFQLVAS